MRTRQERKPEKREEWKNAKIEEFCESNSRTRLIFLSPRLSTILPFFRFSPLSGSRLWILYRPRKRRSTINCFNQILQLNWIESSSSQLPEQRRPGGKETQTKDICPTGMTIMQCSLFDAKSLYTYILRHFFVPKMYYLLFSFDNERSVYLPAVPYLLPNSFKWVQARIMEYQYYL